MGTTCTELSMKGLPCCQPESSQRGPTDDNSCTERRRGRIHLPTTAPHNEPPMRAQTHTDWFVWHAGHSAPALFTPNLYGAPKQLQITWMAKIWNWDDVGQQSWSKSHNHCLRRSRNWLSGVAERHTCASSSLLYLKINPKIKKIRLKQHKFWINTGSTFNKCRGFYLIFSFHCINHITRGSDHDTVIVSSIYR